MEEKRSPELYPPMVKLLIYVMATAIVMSGCAYRNINLVSEPPGVVVDVDSKKCVTPCTVLVDCESVEAVFTNHADDKIYVNIPECDLVDRLSYEAANGAEAALKAIAVPFAVIGLIGISVIGDDAENDDSTHRDTYLISAGSLAAAVVFYTGGEMCSYLKESQSLDAEVYVKFEIPSENP